MNTAQPLKSLYTRIIDALNVLVLLGALAIVASLSYDILTIGRYRPESPLMLGIQLVVCTIFILDFLVRWIISPHKGRFVARNFMLLLFSIPYLNILHYSQIEVSHQVHYLLGFVPLLRGGYGLVMITRWFTRRSATSLMVSYLSILVAVTYFISLIFFVVERGVNPGVKDYWDALWWACMDMTTVGCDIVAVTPIGKIISFILAAAGIMMLPIFTVYITDRIAHSRNGNDKNATSESASDAGAKTSE